MLEAAKVIVSALSQQRYERNNNNPFHFGHKYTKVRASSLFFYPKYNPRPVGNCLQSV